MLIEINTITTVNGKREISMVDFFILIFKTPRGASFLPQCSGEDTVLFGSQEANQNSLDTLDFCLQMDILHVHVFKYISHMTVKGKPLTHGQRFNFQSPVAEWLT